MAQLKSPSAPPGFSTQEELRALLLEGLDSGDGVEMTPAEWQRLYDELDTVREHRKAS